MITDRSHAPGVPGKRDFVSPARLSWITEEGGGIEDSSVAVAVRVRPFVQQEVRSFAEGRVTVS